MRAKKQFLESDHLRYDNDMLRKKIVKHRIKKSTIMCLFGQTTTITVDRWMKGEDIYLYNLMQICNRIGFDLLEFVTYDGHRFGITLEQLKLIEESGIDWDALCEERGIERVKKDDGAAARGKNPDGEEDVHEEENVRTKAAPIDNGSYVSMKLMIDKIVEVQRDAFETALKHATQDRRDMQALLDRKTRESCEKDVEIERLLKEIERLRGRKKYAVVADDTDAAGTGDTLASQLPDTTADAAATDKTQG